MTTENRSKLTLGLKKKSPDTETQRPRIKLGLKKKYPANQPQDDPQTQQNRSKLLLGIRKKTGLFKPKNATEPVAYQKRSRLVPGGARTPSEFVLQPLTRPPRRPAPRPSLLRMPKTPGRLEVNIKITELPNWVETVKRGWQRLCINAEGQIIEMKVRPRIWNKLLQANEKYPSWMASITGKMGSRIKNGFVLLEPAVQIYERNSQESTPPENEEESR